MLRVSSYLLIEVAVVEAEGTGPRSGKLSQLPVIGVKVEVALSAILSRLLPPFHYRPNQPSTLLCQKTVVGSATHTVHALAPNLPQCPASGTCTRPVLPFVIP